MSTKVSRSKKVDAPVVEVKPEPVVEVKTDVVDEVEDADESKRQSLDELLELQSNLIKQATQLMSQAKAMNQQIRRAHNFEVRLQNQRKKVRKTVVHSGILKLVALPPEASAFLKAVNVALPENNLMRRTELSGAIYDYVKANNLYKPDPSKDSGYDRKVIIPDVKLRTLFSLSADKTLDFSSINVNLATIYRRAKEAAEADGSAVPAAPAAAKTAAAPAAAKKGKAAGASA